METGRLDIGAVTLDDQAATFSSSPRYGGDRGPAARPGGPHKVRTTAARTGRSSVALAGRRSVSNGVDWPGFESLGAEPSGNRGGRFCGVSGSAWTRPGGSDHHLLGFPDSRSVVKGVSRPERGNFNNRDVRGGLVSTGSGDEERGWAAEKRDFVADRRDEVADERDRVAEIRDRTVDAREAELDEWDVAWTPAPRSLAFPMKGLRFLHRGPRPVPDGRRPGRTERRPVRNGR